MIKEEERQGRDRRGGLGRREGTGRVVATIRLIVHVTSEVEKCNVEGERAKNKKKEKKPPEKHKWRQTGDLGVKSIR